jgi:hypothetical protein
VLPPKLTKARRRTLELLGATHPDAYFALEVVDQGYDRIPIFRARLKSVPCPTCGHPTKETPIDWDVVEALNKAGLVAERIKGSSAYYITDAGRAALSARPRP